MLLYVRMSVCNGVPKQLKIQCVLPSPPFRIQCVLLSPPFRIQCVLPSPLSEFSARKIWRASPIFCQLFLKTNSTCLCVFCMHLKEPVNCMLMKIIFEGKKDKTSQLCYFSALNLLNKIELLQCQNQLLYFKNLISLVRLKLISSIGQLQVS